MVISRGKISSQVIKVILPPVLATCFCASDCVPSMLCFRQPKKKLWLDDRKWLHDRYDEHAQMPKTRQELIAVYGHDIRTSGRPDGDSMTRRRGRAR